MSRWSHEHPDDPEGAWERALDRADLAKTQARENAGTKLYPTTMSRHAPARTLEEYRDWLYLERDAAPQRSARALDLTARIRAIEDEIGRRT